MVGMLAAVGSAEHGVCFQVHEMLGWSCVYGARCTQVAWRAGGGEIEVIKSFEPELI